jgi:hypothetical protein
MAFDNKESLKILKEKSEFVNWKKKRQCDDKKRKRTKRHTRN